MYRAVVFAALAFYRYVLRDSIPRLCQQAIYSSSTFCCTLRWVSLSKEEQSEEEETRYTQMVV